MHKKTAGLKKRITMRDNEKEKTKRSEIYNKFPQMSSQGFMQLSFGGITLL